MLKSVAGHWWQTDPDNCMKMDGIFYRTDLKYLYRIDRRPPAVIKEAGGFHPSPTALVGPATDTLQGKVYCAGECLQAGRQAGTMVLAELTPAVAYHELEQPAGAQSRGSSSHIYRFDATGLRCVRYVDNLGLPYVEGQFRVVAFAEVDEGYYSPRQSIFNMKISGRNYDVLESTKHRCAYGEVFVLDPAVPAVLEYGGTGNGLLNAWVKLESGTKAAGHRGGGLW